MILMDDIFQDDFELLLIGENFSQEMKVKSKPINESSMNDRLPNCDLELVKEFDVEPGFGNLK